MFLVENADWPGRVHHVRVFFRVSKCQERVRSVSFSLNTAQEFSILKFQIFVFVTFKDKIRDI